MAKYLCVSDRREGPVDSRRLCGHGEEGGHPQRHPGWHRAAVQPEGDPGHDDQHAGGNVDGQEVVGELTPVLYLL